MSILQVDGWKQERIRFRSLDYMRRRRVFGYIEDVNFTIVYFHVYSY